MNLSRLMKRSCRLQNTRPCTRFLRRKKSHYITTPIFYVNSVPHIGHLYTASIADAKHRWTNIKLNECGVRPENVFSTGTDEHGQKIYQAAKYAGMNPQMFCDKISDRFKELFDKCNIEYTDFIRTTEPRHKVAVEHFWKALKSRGFIEKATYEGWYSTQDETFVSENNTKVVKDKEGKDIRIFEESGHTVEWMKEDNYVFRLSSVAEQVKQWVEENRNCAYPTKFRDLLLVYLNEPLYDISVSREISRVFWGISTPSDPTQSIYVWLDALVNYLTVVGYPDISSEKFKRLWPADIHVIGVDILRFHAIFWPAFLIAAGLELPKQIVVHSHWTVNKTKMSKSLGNTIEPFTLANRVSGDGLRYFLLRQGVLEHNCDYSNKLLFQAVNGELCNTLGNCLNRSVAPKLNPEQIYPTFHNRFFQGCQSNISGPPVCAHEDDYGIIKMVQALPDRVDEHYESFHFYKAAIEIISCVREANYCIQQHKLWRLNSSVSDEKQFRDTIIHVVYETLRVCGILMQPLIPSLSAKLLKRLNVQPHERTFSHAKNSFCSFGNDNALCPMTGRKLGEDEGVLIERVDEEE